MPFLLTRNALGGAALAYEAALALKPLDLSTLYNHGTVLLELAHCPPAPPPEEADGWLVRAVESLVAVETADTSRRSQALLLARVNRLAALSGRGDIARAAGHPGQAEALYAEACTLVDLEALGDWQLADDAHVSTAARSPPCRPTACSLPIQSNAPFACSCTHRLQLHSCTCQLPVSQAMYNLGDAFGHRAGLRLEAAADAEGGEVAAGLLEEAAALGGQACYAYEGALWARELPEGAGQGFDCEVLTAACSTATDLAVGLLAADPQPPAEGRIAAAAGFAESAARHAQSLASLHGLFDDLVPGVTRPPRPMLLHGLALAAVARVRTEAAGGAEATGGLVAEAVAGLEAAAEAAAAVGGVRAAAIRFEGCAAAGELLLDHGRLLAVGSQARAVWRPASV